MITYKKVDRTYFPQYNSIPMCINVESYYKIEKINRGLGGFNFIEISVEPYIKDFCSDNKTVTQWERFDLTNWAFFMAFDGKRPVGAVAVASRTKGLNMLSGRNDLAVLWDIRVDEIYKNQGIGQTLFDMVVKWSREQGLTQMKIECQNNNVPAIKFYHKQGATLSAIDEYAYNNEPKCKHETMLIWVLDL
ncbi:MAG: GNAT family N-acetyltransferase [Oscillospiraceae bacterium]|nr:GNAT family N-acetyltransferase [Oscillospiraceae bacterium]